jgi:hypothetical protein
MARSAARPALTRHKFCFFHQRWREASIKLSAGRPRSSPNFQLPVLEDANSIQVALMQVVAMILSGELEAKRGGLVLYALQIASANLHIATFEPKVRHVVVHPEWVRDTPLGQDQFQETGDYVEEDGEDEDVAEAAEDSEGAEQEEAAEAVEGDAAMTEAASEPQAEHADSEDEAAADSQTSPPLTLAEARANVKKQVMAAYPKIMASLKDLKACAAGTGRRRNGRRLLNSA